MCGWRNQVNGNLWLINKMINYNMSVVHVATIVYIFLPKYVGYLKLLRSRIVHLVHSQAHLSRIFQALVMVSETKRLEYFKVTFFCRYIVISVCPGGV